MDIYHGYFFVNVYFYKGIARLWPKVLREKVLCYLESTQPAISHNSIVDCGGLPPVDS